MPSAGLNTESSIAAGALKDSVDDEMLLLMLWNLLPPPSAASTCTGTCTTLNLKRTTKYIIYCFNITNERKFYYLCDDGAWSRTLLTWNRLLVGWPSWTFGWPEQAEAKYGGWEHWHGSHSMVIRRAIFSDMQLATSTL